MGMTTANQLSVTISVALAENQRRFVVASRVRFPYNILPELLMDQTHNKVLAWHLSYS
jgi:hypothetical protein